MNFQKNRKKKAGGKEKKGKRQRDEEDHEEEESLGEENSDDDDNDNDVNDHKGDGFADMMAKILSQKVDRKIPILAKRKTPIMKEMEEETEDKERLKRLRIERRAQKDKQMVVPDVLSTNYERQLKKLATRGVVALFNAIAKAKRDTAEMAASSVKPAESSNKDISRIDVKKMTKENFLAMLKGPSSSVESTKKSSNGEKVRRGDESDSDDNNSSAKEKPSTWKALQDNFWVDKGMALKHWDKDVVSSDDDESSENEDGKLEMSKAANEKNKSNTKSNKDPKGQTLFDEVPPSDDDTDKTSIRAHKKSAHKNNKVASSGHKKGSSRSR